MFLSNQIKNVLTFSKDRNLGELDRGTLSVRGKMTSDPERVDAGAVPHTTAIIVDSEGKLPWILPLNSPSFAGASWFLFLRF